jgi:hypothetical protein
MTVDRRKTIIEELNAEGLTLIESKGRAYAGDGDSLANFKRNAERLGLTKYQIWATYFNKHIDSINSAIQQNPNNPVDKTEGLKGRIIDAKNYLDILYCLLEEDHDITRE